MNDNSILEAITNRRSIREFTDEKVTLEDLMTIVEAGIWAPSGKNNQPWRFVLVTEDSVRQRLADFTIYSHIIINCRALIVVYVDQSAMYDKVKDHQSAGAAIQNMLLATEAIGLGAVWLGQILKNSSQVSAELGIDEQYSLMAVLALGHPLHKNQKSQRKNISDFIIGGKK